MMRLTNYEAKAHASALEKSALHKASEETLILDLIVAVETRFYRKLGKPNLHMYIVETLGYDTNFAYHLDNVAQRSQKFLAVRKALFQKRLNVGKALRIGAHLTIDNAEELVEFACTHTFKDVNARVAALKNPLKRKESATLRGDQVDIRIFTTPEKFRVLKRAQIVESNANRKSTMEETIFSALKTHLHKHDPVEKAKRSQNRARTKPGTPFNAAETHAVNLRDEGRCTFTDENGKRCNCERFLQKHHIISRARGGTNDLVNLSTLCAFHHDLVHQLEFSFEAELRRPH